MTDIYLHFICAHYELYGNAPVSLALPVLIELIGGATWSAIQAATQDNLSNPLTPHRLDLGSGVYDARTQQIFLHFGETTQPPGGNTTYKYAPPYILRGAVPSPSNNC